MNNDSPWIGLAVCLCALVAIGCFIRLYCDQQMVIRQLREQLAEKEKELQLAEKEKESMPAPIPPEMPMPGTPFIVGRIRVTKLDLDDIPEWMQHLYADETYQGPIPTFEDLEASLFAEIERLGWKIPLEES